MNRSKLIECMGYDQNVCGEMAHLDEWMRRNGAIIGSAPELVKT
jgi:hypothetical protein